MPTVLVTDGDQRAALAIVRSLGRAGHRVFVGASAERSLAGCSRYRVASLRLPEPLADPEGFARAVRSCVRERGVDAVLPVTEAALLALLPRRAELAPAVVPFPDAEAFARASDKAWVARVAATVGLSAPRSELVRSAAAADELPAHLGPAVLKPSRSVVAGRKLGVSHVAEDEDLRAALRALPAEAFPVLVQERVVGPGIGVFLLRWDGRTVASFAHRRLREKPPSGGVSVLRESVPLESGLLAACEALLAELDWRGVAMVELKVDHRTGEPFVMEVNGRFWGSLQLAIDAGVDFPALLLDLALGREVNAPRSYRTGVRSRWLMGDVDHLLARMLRSPERLHLPADAPGRLRVLADFMAAFLPPNREEILRPGDPRPFLCEVGAWLKALGSQPASPSASR